MVRGQVSRLVFPVRRVLRGLPPRRGPQRPPAAARFPAARTALLLDVPRLLRLRAGSSPSSRRRTDPVLLLARVRLARRVESWPLHGGSQLLRPLPRLGGI